MSDLNIEKSAFDFYNTKDEKNPHYFMCEELLISHANHNDYQRLNMFSSQIHQLLHLKSPEYPRVFTNFENQIGKYSPAYKKAESDLKVIAKIPKNEYNHTLVVQDVETGIYDVIHFNTGIHLNEEHGYKMCDSLPRLRDGQTIPKGEFIYKSNDFDEHGNMGYGVNLNTVFLNKDISTYEDGILISESAAKKLTTYSVKKIMVSIGYNDILLNVNGDKENFKALPRVGDKHGVILSAIRKRNNRTVFYDLKPESLMEIDPTTDDIIYSGGGIVTDINVFSNSTLDDLKEKHNTLYGKELHDIYEEEWFYYKRLAEVLETIIPIDRQLRRDQNIAVPRETVKNKNKYTDDLAFAWKVAHEYINPDLKWRDDGKEFGFIRLQFTVLKEEPAELGIKISGKVGNKGVVSKIIPDDQMPFCKETGEHVEVCMNPLGVISRLNMGQLIECHINFMSKRVVLEIKNCKSLSEKEKLFFTYLKELNPKQHDFYEEKYSTMGDLARQMFFKEIETKGIYIHEPPMYENTDFEKFVEISDKYPEWVKPFTFDGANKPLVMGEMYIVRLRHQSSNKASIRSARNLNVKNLPPRSKLKKDNKILFNNNALMWGRMEVNQLFLTKNPQAIEKFLKLYSTDPQAREEFIKQLLLSGYDEGKKKNVFKLISDVNLNTSINRKILDKYLNIIGIGLKD